MLKRIHFCVQLQVMTQQQEPRTVLCPALVAVFIESVRLNIRNVIELKKKFTYHNTL